MFAQSPPEWQRILLSHVLGEASNLVDEVRQSCTIGKHKKEIHEYVPFKHCSCSLTEQTVPTITC